MGADEPDSHLSRITTLWPVLEQAHGGSKGAAASAQRLLMERYRGAVYRYLLGAMRNQDAADELFQEFALRFCRGDFRRADPRRGRFRDYVKTALIHLADDYHRRRKAAPAPLPDDVPGPSGAAPALEEEARFARSWSKELVNQAWAELDKGHPALGAALRLHVEKPDAASRELAADLSGRLGKAVTPTNARVMLHRAREKFAELLVVEVRRSLEDPTEQELLQELRDLHLLAHCRPVLEKGKLRG